MGANNVSFAGYPGYVNTTFEQNMVDKIREFRATVGAIDPNTVSGDKLQKIDSNLDKAVSEMKSQDDGYTAAEKDQVRKFIDRAETLISQAKQESAAYVAPQPAPAPVQPDVAPTPSPSDGSTTPTSGLYGDFVLDSSSTGNEARFLAAYPTRPNDPLEARSYGLTLGLARVSDDSALSLQSMQDSMKNQRRQVQPV